jgi:hypothetical protein
MATLRKEIVTRAWAAIEDTGALHTRLVPGFVTATRLEPGARIVTFANGMTVREPIIGVDPAGVDGGERDYHALQCGGAGVCGQRGRCGPWTFCRTRPRRRLSR